MRAVHRPLLPPVPPAGRQVGGRTRGTRDEGRGTRTTGRESTVPKGKKKIDFGIDTNRKKVEFAMFDFGSMTGRFEIGVRGFETIPGFNYGSMFEYGMVFRDNS